MNNNVVMAFIRAARGITKYTARAAYKRRNDSILLTAARRPPRGNKGVSK